MLLTIKDLSQQLQIKPATLYVWVGQGKIPCLKIHGLIRFESSAIEQWVRSFSTPDHHPLPKHLGKGAGLNIDHVIACAKRTVYTASCGKPDQDRATGKEGNDGSV